MSPLFRNPFRDEIAAKPERKVLPAPSGEGAARDDLLPNEFYFEIRLCEVYLRKSAEAGRTFVPRTLAITECLYGNNVELTLPMAVGEQILDEIQARMGDAGRGQAISLSDCLLAGPMPYRGSDIGFFGGLYRVERGNWADSAFNLVADLTSDLCVDVSKYAEVGRKLVTRLPSLLGVGSDDWRFGHYGPIYKESDSFFDRYLILAGTNGGRVDWNAMEVRQEGPQEMLHIKSGAGSEPYVDRDFALFRLRSRQTRGDYTRFGFNARFDEAKRHLTAGQTERAEWTRIQLLQEISDCPDLIEAHQLTLVAGFNLKLEKWKQNLTTPRRVGAQPANQRGGPRGGVAQTIGATAATANRKGLPRETVAALSNMAKSWDRLSNLPIIAKDDVPSDAEIDAFLTDADTRRILGGSAADLVDALKYQSFLKHG